MDPLTDWLIARALLFIAAAVFILVVFKFRLKFHVKSLAGTIQKATSVFSSPLISDHWKEKSFLIYSKLIFTSVCKLSLILSIASLGIIGAIFISPGLYSYTMSILGVIELVIYSVALYVLSKYIQA